MFVDKHHMDTKNKETGDAGEDFACNFLISNGFRILKRNYFVGKGEIDIIARKKLPFWQFFSRSLRPIHFVEVKTIVDSDRGFFPEQHVNHRGRAQRRGSRGHGGAVSDLRHREAPPAQLTPPAQAG